MTMTRESDYAVRIMRALSHGSLKTVKEICGEEAIPTQFAYKILKKLSNAGLIQIIRGAAGGYKLDKDLHDVSLLDIMHAIGEKDVVNACIQDNYQCTWREKYHKPCQVHEELVRIQGTLDHELERHSIHEILYGESKGETH